MSFSRPASRREIEIIFPMIWLSSAVGFTESVLRGGEGGSTQVQFNVFPQAQFKSGENLIGFGSVRPDEGIRIPAYSPRTQMLAL